MQSLSYWYKIFLCGHFTSPTSQIYPYKNLDFDSSFTERCSFESQSTFPIFAARTFLESIHFCLQHHAHPHPLAAPLVSLWTANATPGPQPLLPSSIPSHLPQGLLQTQTCPHPVLLVASHCSNIKIRFCKPQFQTLENMPHTTAASAHLIHPPCLWTPATLAFASVFYSANAFLPRVLSLPSSSWRALPACPVPTHLWRRLQLPPGSFPQ